MQYELVMLADGVETKKKYKSMLKMSKDINIPYHTLKKILDRNNEPNPRYKHTPINEFMKKIKIYKVVDLTSDSTSC